MTTRLLAADEASPYSVRSEGAAGPFLLIGDHAGVAIPRQLGDLGLTPAALGAHIASDIGVDGLGERLSALLAATFIAQRYSRLVIDCNRDPARPDAMCEVSDGIAVPGNLGLDDAARAQRIDEVFRPYHDRIAAELDARAGSPTLLVSLHSFTPVMGGAARPWRFGVLHLPGSRFSDAVLARLRDTPGAGEIGDNAPYAMDGTDYTVPYHAVARGLDYVELEVRQDLLADAAGQDRIAALLAPVLRSAAEALMPAG